MNLMDLMPMSLVKLDLKGCTREEVIEEMAEMICCEGFLGDRDAYVRDVMAREALGTTGVGMGIAIPHGKSSGVKKPCVAFGRKASGIEWGSLDGEPARLVFMIAVPAEGALDQHLKILQSLSRRLMDDPLREGLMRATSPSDAIALLCRED
ncbi:PTS sugar transporter subunit IIA [Thermanaerovibrio velox]|uniref:PTS sugar transporter subunit IIA n=1 Tax=Thermanaerovibrio velox TaxID=108007 RepID=UPI00059546B5|nr:fructose PTS transporter subunit IIA [Thermanaerovibrio velox]